MGTIGGVPREDIEDLMRHAVDALDSLAKAVVGEDALPSEMVRLAECVSTARRDLYSCLIQGGWVAPGDVLSGMGTDRALLREGLGRAFDDTPVARQ